MSEHLPGVAGRRQRPDQWHVTLQFLGDVPESRLPAVLDAGSAASGAAMACDIAFDRLEYWKRPQVLCLAAGLAPEALVALAGALRQELRRRGFTFDERPFRAHVTLVRGLGQRPPRPAFEPLVWPVHGYSLVQSMTERSGARYVEIAAWPARS